MSTPRLFDTAAVKPINSLRLTPESRFSRMVVMAITLPARSRLLHCVLAIDRLARQWHAAPRSVRACRRVAPFCAGSELAPTATIALEFAL